ncbi:unnamed protein product [Peniophora sp. CBMAI 1063]|nr:unnamed protein product [Peniophora sp. CBMAI 1063]
MAFSCTICNLSYPVRSHLARHYREKHHLPDVKKAPSTFKYHPYLTAQPCDERGQYLPPGTPPPPRVDPPPTDWHPFASRPAFAFAELTFEVMQASNTNVDELLSIWAEYNELADGPPPPFADHKDVLAHIDAIQHGDAPYICYTVKYTGPTDNNSPSWMLEPCKFYTRDARLVAHNMMASSDLDGKFNYRPYVELKNDGQRTWSNIMSADWAHKQATEIAKDANSHGAMFVPIVLGADKTTVTVGTGNIEFHPLYFGLGNVTNSARRAHREAITPIAFLHIPHAPRDEAKTAEFRIFKKQLYHASITHILSPLRRGMTTPDVVKCPDGHFRRAIYEIGPFIADYPEQVVLAGIVQNRCPKCLLQATELEDGAGPRRTRAKYDHAMEHLDAEDLWDTYGIVCDVVPFTNEFPRADIYELITPDLLHQLIKGSFKDHIVSWIQKYVEAVHQPAEARKIMDDIDRKIAAVPPFPGLRRFPQGRNFKQWTGNDSKALMKVIIPALVGHLPNDMIKAIRAFMDFCYYARRSSHTLVTLQKMEECLTRYKLLRESFRMDGVRDDFNLPRQHALWHYVRGIKLFGSPNGLCTSITESKHIAAVKRPWRRSNRNNAIWQMLRTNIRMAKLAALRHEFARRGMIRSPDVMSRLRRVLGLRQGPSNDDDEDADAVAAYQHGEDDEDADEAEGEAQIISVFLASKYKFSRPIARVAHDLKQPRLLELIRRYLQDYLYPDPDLTADIIPLNECPLFEGNVAVFGSARALYYAPSEVAGDGGMHMEIIRSASRWYGQYARRDTVLIQNGPETDPMGGLAIGRVMAFLSFEFADVDHPCALVEWHMPVADEIDPVTGMWIVEPEILPSGSRRVELVHLDCIVRSCLLQGVTDDTYLPKKFHYSKTHSGFQSFYFNRYADYHTHEMYPE